MVVRRRAGGWAGRVPANECLSLAHSRECHFEAAPVFTSHHRQERHSNASCGDYPSARAAHVPAFIFLAGMVGFTHLSLLTGGTEDAETSVLFIIGAQSEPSLASSEP